MTESQSNNSPTKCHEQNSLLLFGAGGHAKSCIDVIERHGYFKIKRLIGLSSEQGQKIMGYPILSEDNLIKDASNALITVGQIKTPSIRIRLYKQLKDHDYFLPIIVSPLAYVSPHAEIGEGTIVMHGAIINAGVKVGRNCIVNSGCLIEHDVEIQDHCHLATKSVINGGVKIGDGTFVGSGCQIKQMLTIGSNCLIGMGQVVLKNCPDNMCLPVLKNREII